MPQNILGVRVDIYNKAEVLKKLAESIYRPTFQHIATVNPEFLVEAQHNVAFKQILNNTTLNVCDGFGISFWTKILYKKKIPRFTGVELAQELCCLAAGQGKSVYFLGGFGVAKIAAQKMQSLYPSLKVAGHEDGDPQKLSNQLIDAQPDILLVAFGAPAQELWINKFKVDLPTLKIAIGVGGTFDFWAGKTIRAPKLLRTVGLEWLWRLLTQPHRFRRIWNAVVMFSYLAIKERFQGRP